MLIRRLLHLTQILAILSFSLLSNSSFALTSDQKQPVYLQSDTAVLNHKTGISIYRGNVKLTQGTTIVTGDTLTTYMDENSQITKAIATGQLASYTTLPDNSKLLFVGIAQVINYYPPQGHVEFIGTAKATQGADTFTGPQLNYNINTQVVTSPSSHIGRTSIIIQPNQKEN